MLQSLARAKRPSTKRQSAPARADSPNDSPYASILGIDVADESYSPTVRMPVAVAYRHSVLEIDPMHAWCLTGHVAVVHVLDCIALPSW